MKTLKQVPVVPVYVEFIPDQLEEGKIYISEQYKTAIHNCLCGCGYRTVTPFSSKFPQHWRLIREAEGVISLVGSVLNHQAACKSHYIITKNLANFV